MPPRVVRIPSAACIPWISSGDVSTRDQDDLLALGLERLRLVCGQHDLARSRARRGRQPGGDDLALDTGIDGGMQKLIEPAGLDASDRLLAGDQAFVGELDRDLERRFGGALARAGLQHPELALLDGELEILHVAIVSLEEV